jgi:hypothetical protein
MMKTDDDMCVMDANMCSSKICDPLTCFNPLTLLNHQEKRLCCRLSSRSREVESAMHEHLSITVSPGVRVSSWSACGRK